MKKILIIDGNTVIYRLFYATQKLNFKTNDGTPTNCLMTFTRIIENLINKITPSHMVIAFDHKDPTFRHNEYEDYKAKRKPMPEDLVKQLPAIYEYVRLRGIRIFQYPGYEADDVIGTIAKKLTKDDNFTKVEILTSDKDLFQLIDNNISILRITQGFKNFTKYDYLNQEDLLDCKPSEIPDYKALAGDQSDGIPGVKRLGSPQSIKLLKEYHNIENIFKNIDNLPTKIKNILNNKEEIVKKWKFLATIDINIDIDLKSQDIILQYELSEFQKHEIELFFDKWELMAVKKWFKNHFWNNELYAVVDIGSFATKMTCFLKQNNKLLKLWHKINPTKTFNLLDENHIINKQNQNIIIRDVKSQIDYLNNIYNEFPKRNIFYYGTECLRRAKNNIEIINNVNNALGIDLKIISQVDESFYNFYAFRKELSSIDHGFILDIGGGSIEIVESYKKKKHNHYFTREGLMVLMKKFNLTIDSDYSSVKEYLAEIFKNSKFNQNGVVISSSGSFRSVIEIRNYFFKVPSDKRSVFYFSDLNKIWNKIQKFSINDFKNIPWFSMERVEIVKLSVCLLIALSESLKINKFILANSSIRKGFLEFHLKKDK